VHCTAWASNSSTLPDLVNHHVYLHEHHLVQSSVYAYILGHCRSTQVRNVPHIPAPLTHCTPSFRHGQQSRRMVCALETVTRMGASLYVVLQVCSCLMDFRIVHLQVCSTTPF
jgi:hypothetical protein